MSDRNIQIIQQIYAAFGRGDVPGIMEHIAEDLRRFSVASELQVAPWHMQITKKADVPSFFKALAETCEFTRFEPHDFAAAGDVVYCSVRFDVTLKTTGRKLQIDDEMHRFTLRNGRVVEWRGAEDTALIADALLA